MYNLSENPHSNPKSRSVGRLVSGILREGMSFGGSVGRAMEAQTRVLRTDARFTHRHSGNTIQRYTWIDAYNCDESVGKAAAPVCVMGLHKTSQTLTQKKSRMVRKLDKKVLGKNPINPNGASGWILKQHGNKRRMETEMAHNIDLHASIASVSMSCVCITHDGSSAACR